MLPAGESGKTEAWVVLEAGPESRIYAGLKPGTTPDDLRRALANRTVADHLASFTPRPGDAVFIRAGTVHSLGGGVVVFEVQENSDVTFRLYDWDRVDAQDRPASCPASRSGDGLHRFRANRDRSGDAGGGSDDAGAARATLPLLNSSRCGGSAGPSPFSVGAADTPRVLVCIAGEGRAGAGWHPLSRRPRRRRPLAGGGRRVFLPAARCRQLVGSRPAGIVLARAGSGW